jgi:hypothetical protein
VVALLQMFGRLQSKLFPQYFAITTGSAALLLGSVLLGAIAAPQNGVSLLAAATIGSAANALLIEPRATALMFERYEIENKPGKSAQDEADIKRLYKAFGAWHGVSSLANLVVLAASIAYGWALAGRLAL